MLTKTQISMQTVSELLAPFEFVFEQGSFQSFSKRWSKKMCERRDIIVLSHIMSNHGNLFTKNNLSNALASIESRYKKRLKKREEILTLTDGEYKKRQMITVSGNLWEESVIRQFEKFTTVPKKTELGAMMYRLFFASITIINNEYKRNEEKLAREIIDELSQERTPDEEKPLNVFELDLEEQIKLLNLHRDTYF